MPLICRPSIRQLRRHVLVAVCAGSLAFATGAWAEIRSIELPLVMACPMSDPPIFEALLLQVNGVRSVEVSYEKMNATITFDDSEASAVDFGDALLAFFPEPDAGVDTMDSNPAEALSEDDMDGM